ncbi:hypothetical protein WME98_51280 [Sorangium sp. So ce296]|uniref:hypothetical protein n=1 Tax=Sorangium sp. So ce296 TaxID=3133296 RepID=UPI003F60B671
MSNPDVTSEFKTILEKLLAAGHSILVEEKDYESDSIPDIWGMTQEGKVRWSRANEIHLVELLSPSRTEPARVHRLTKEQRQELVESLKDLAEENLKRIGGYGEGNWIGIEDEHRSIPTNRTAPGSRTHLGLDSRARPGFDSRVRFTLKYRVVNEGIHEGKSLFMVQASRRRDDRTISEQLL